MAYIEQITRNILSAEYITTGATTNDNILPLIGTGSTYVITSISAVASSSNVSTPSVRIGFGSSAITSQGASNDDAVNKIVLSHPGIPAGSGIVKGNGSGIVGRGEGGEEFRVTTSGGIIIIQVDYFIESI